MHGDGRRGIYWGGDGEGWQIIAEKNQKEQALGIISEALSKMLKGSLLFQLLQCPIIKLDRHSEIAFG